ncbi:MAG: hypothetical protein JWN73_4847 [Betaproteobacteria bacterium]|nr:hypothetical protein [Betaproteobacteria bacterium]
MIALCCVLSTSAHGADRIDTDGPDFVESTGSVAKGRFQFETGPQQTSDRRPGAHTNTAATPLLLKAGIGKGMELRLETDGYSHVGGADAPGVPGGMADTAIGIKWHVQDSEESTMKPALAWIAHVELPSGSPALRGIGLRPSLRAVIGWDLPHDFTLGVMPGVKLDIRADGHRFVSGILGVVAGYWWTPRLRSFIEAEADSIARAQDGGVIFYKNAGAAYLIADDWQIGGRAGWAANSNTPSRYFMLSLAGRF